MKTKKTSKAPRELHWICKRCNMPTYLAMGQRRCACDRPTR